MVKNKKEKIIKNLWLAFWIVAVFFPLGACKAALIAGEKDPSFFTGIPNSSYFVNDSVIQPDGKTIIVGSYDEYNGVHVGRIARLNIDGTLDTTFNSGNVGADSQINTVALQSDGKIIIGGLFYYFNGTAVRYFARLNTDGSLDTSFNVGTNLSSFVNDIITQSDGKMIITGAFSTYKGVTRNKIARVNVDGSLDTTFDPGTGINNYSVFTSAFQSDGKIIIGGSFSSYNGITRNKIARINTDGSLDTTFDPGLGGGTVSSYYVYSISIQPDGKMVIGGYFPRYGGVNSSNIARVNADGSLDTTFVVGSGANNYVQQVNVLPDSKIVISGLFTSYNGNARGRIARLNADGTNDATFNPGRGASGSSDYISSTLVQSDGKILIGGAFQYYDGWYKNGFLRINANGSVDTAFNPPVGINGPTEVVKIQSDGKMIVGGKFTTYGQISRNGIVRLNADGTLDTTFDPGTGAGMGSLYATIYSAAVQSDGKIIIGGNFSSYNGTAINRITRLNSDGTLDTSFNVGTGASDIVTAISVQSDGKIIIGGSFTSYNGTARNRIARLNSDGSLDTSFNIGTGANSQVYEIISLSDGKVLVGGSFSTFNGVTNRYIARLNSDGSLDNTFVTGTGASSTIMDMCLQSGDKIIIAGNFTSYNGTTLRRIARLNNDGSLDTSFYTATGFDNYVYSLGVQSDGKIIVGGIFNNHGTTPRSHIARLNGDGTLDYLFDPGTGTGINHTVEDIAVQSDDKSMIVGSISTYNDEPASYIVRLEKHTDIVVPTMTTQSASNIYSISATGNGTVASTGFENPTRSIEWGTSSGNYTDSCSAGVGATGTFSCAMTSLIPDTTYYVRATATNSAGTGYGNEITFQTPPPPVAPTVVTDPVVGSRGYGNITDTGGENPQRFIEWGTSSGNYTSSCTAGVGGVGSYSCLVTGLSSDTTYYVRAGATNAAGTSYGEEVSFDTPWSLTEQIIPHEFQGGGTARGWRDDDMAWTYSLPFTYNFYGIDYNDIKISSNGYICLDSATDCTDSTPTLDSSYDGPRIIPLGKDLQTNVNAENDIYITENADSVIIRWSVVQYGRTTNINFEVVLYQNGNIAFNYGIQDSPPLTSGAVVGISRGDGAFYVTSVYNNATNFNEIDTSFWGDFSPPAVVPTLTIPSIASVTATGVTINANIADTGGDDPERFIEWGVVSGTYTNSCAVGMGGVGNYSCDLSSLLPDTTYYARAFATNSAGTSYSEEISFVTLSGSGTEDGEENGEDNNSNENNDNEDNNESEDLTIEIINIKDITKDSLKLRVEVKNNEDDELDFKVEIKNKKTGKKQKIKLKKVKVSDSGRATLDIDNLIPNTDYSFKVKVSKEKEDDYSELSNSKKAKTKKDKDKEDNLNVEADEQNNSDDNVDSAQDEVTAQEDETASTLENENSSQEDYANNNGLVVLPSSSNEVVDNNDDDSSENQKIVEVLATVIGSLGLLLAIAKTLFKIPLTFISFTPRILQAPLLFSATHLVKRRAIAALQFFPFLTSNSKEKFSLPFYKNEKSKFWGTIFDSYTKEPISNVLISLKSVEKERVIESVVSDEEGRFGFLIGEDGEYEVAIKKGAYVLDGRNEKDTIYGNLYTKAVSLKKGEVFDLNISLTAPNFNWDDFSKKIIKKYNSLFFKFLRNFFNILYYAGIIFSVYNVIYYPNLFNYLSLLFYAVLLVYGVILGNNKNFGIVLKKESKSPLPFTVVALHDSRTRERVKFAISNILGRYYLLAQNGNYILKLKYIDMSGGSFEREKSVTVTRGIFRDDFML